MACQAWWFPAGSEFLQVPPEHTASSMPSRHRSCLRGILVHRPFSIFGLSGVDTDLPRIVLARLLHWIHKVSIDKHLSACVDAILLDLEVDAQMLDSEKVISVALRLTLSGSHCCLRS